MPKHVILFLAANPDGTNPLKLGEECAEIQREFKMTPHRDVFHFEWSKCKEGMDTVGSVACDPELWFRLESDR